MTALVQVSKDGGWTQEVTQSPYSHPSVVESTRVPSSARVYVTLSDPPHSSLSFSTCEVTRNPSWLRSGVGEGCAASGVGRAAVKGPSLPGNQQKPLEIRETGKNP